MTTIPVPFTLKDRLDRIALSALRGLAHRAGSRADTLGALLLLLFAAVVTATAVFFPITEWDVIAYVATVLERTISDPVLLHDQAYQLVREAVQPGRFLVLTADRPYRVAQFADPAAFHTMLGFYRVKWLYIETIALLSRFMTPVEAIHALAAASAAGVGLTVLAWLALARRLCWAPLAIAALVVAGFGALARLGTPDMFATLFFLVGVVGYLWKREAIVALALFAAFLVRPDHLAFVGVFMVVTLWMGQRSIGAIVAFAAAFAAYWPLTAATGHPSWWVQFWFTNVEYVPTLEGFDPDFSLLVYLKALAQVSVRAMVEDAWPGLAIACIAGWIVLEVRGTGPRPRERALIVALLLTMAAKFVILPMHDTRFNFAYVAALALALVTSLPDLRTALSAGRRRGART